MFRTVALTLTFLVANAQTIAFIDLSTPPKSPPPKSLAQGRGHNQGSACFDCPNPGIHGPEPAFSARLMWTLESTDPAPGKGAVELLMTNRGKEPVSIPIGVDKALLKAPATMRKGVSFAVCVKPCGLNDTIGVAESATNLDHPETALNLLPGESVVFKLPFDRHLASFKMEEHSAGSGEACELSVSGGFFTMETDKDGDYSSGLQILTKVENTLKWIPRSN